MVALIFSPSPSLSPSTRLSLSLNRYTLDEFRDRDLAAGTGGDALVRQEEEIARSGRAKNPASLVAAEQQIPAPAQAAV
jgi:hypothetical protein